MNVKNNKRRRESQDKIEKAFVELLQTREIKEITVSDIIKLTGLNRSTFYANYIDIFDLADKTREKLETKLAVLEKEIAKTCDRLNEQSVYVGSILAQADTLGKSLSYNNSEEAKKMLENLEKKLKKSRLKNRKLMIKLHTHGIMIKIT